MSLTVRTDSLYSVWACTLQLASAATSLGCWEGTFLFYAFKGRKLGPWMTKNYFHNHFFFLSHLFLFVCVRQNITLLKAVTTTEGQTHEKILENNTEFTQYMKKILSGDREGYVRNCALPKWGISGWSALSQGSGEGDDGKEMLTQLSDNNFCWPAHFTGLQDKVMRVKLNMNIATTLIQVWFQFVEWWLWLCLLQGLKNSWKMNTYRN